MANSPNAIEAINPNDVNDYAQVPVEFDISIMSCNTGVSAGCIMAFDEEGHMVGVIITGKSNSKITKINALQFNDHWSRAYVSESLKMLGDPEFRKAIDAEVIRHFRRRPDVQMGGNVVALNAGRR